MEWRAEWVILTLAPTWTTTHKGGGLGLTKFESKGGLVVQGAHSLLY